MTFPGSPRLLKGGIILLDPDTAAVQRVVALQYNPDTLTRTLQPKAMEGGGFAEALRLKGPPVESYKLDAEIDAADQLEQADAQTGEIGIHAQLAALETAVYPTSAQLIDTNRLARSGTLEIAPNIGPLTLFVWSKHRVVPVRITDLSITEESFDPSLNPLRAKVSLSMRVLSVDDLGFDAKGGSLYLAYQQQKERFAAQSGGVDLSLLGLSAIP
jgi:hypothetical protein